MSDRYKNFPNKKFNSCKKYPKVEPDVLERVNILPHARHPPLSRSSNKLNARSKYNSAPVRVNVSSRIVSHYRNQNCIRREDRRESCTLSCMCENVILI